MTSRSVAKFTVFALISLILSIGIISAIPFASADSTVPSAKSNPDAAFTAATFADKYQDMSFTGKRVSVVIKMAGESENSDPSKKAKEIRYLQSYVLKFLSFSNAVNVVSNQQKNEITAQIDTAWIPILEQRSDVVSVTVLDIQKDGKEYLESLSPLKQMANGIAPESITCNDGLVLIIKHDGSPACVMSDTAENLEDRGWGVMPPPCCKNLHVDTTCSDEQLLIQDKADEQSCVSAQIVLQQLLDGATILEKSTLKTSQLITKLALSSSNSETLTQQEIFNIATLAYVYGYSPVDVMEARELMAKDPETGEFSVNTMINFKDLLGPDWTAVVSPNRDTLYSPTYLDLAEEPLVFHVPDLDDRYYTFQMIDFYTNNFDYIGKRTTGTDENNFVIVGPDWKGEIPSELDRIDSSTPSIFHLGRTLVSGEEDVPAVHAIQEQYTLTKLSDWKEGKTSLPQTMTYPSYETEGDFAFFHNMNAAITENPPPSNEQNLVDLFAKINMGLNQTFDENSLDDDTAQTIKDAMVVGDSLVTYGSDNVGEKINGWHIPSPETGEFGENFILRSGTSKSMLYLNSPVEAMYPKALEDLDGELLTGENKYTIHFAADKIPPVDAFWSVTMYNSKFLLVDNEIDRYNIGDRTAGLKYNDDGSLDILIQHEAPDDTSNWLPAPEDGFYLINRLYNPQEPALNGEWIPSGVEKNLNP